ncbi:cytochrome b-c1 complex subunit 8 [Peromyscus maniculatus bairdii]|uniref:cytochrome b-c1 complex subunit 8 n=1 Tax=Peromyscus maniculatus bairdii TaxID=230844 RepID=UPI00042A9C59
MTSRPPGPASAPPGSDIEAGRLSAVAAATMGREFGKLAHIRHVISYSLSPFEQRAFPNYFSKGIPNVLRRTRECILRVAPPFVAFYLIYTWGNQEFERSKRKNPAMYENDK